ncbi:uncharacterized protein LOC130930369 isoform X2 [Corythoichthys intestinalis]|uniref:uncharacterized protein LOC130930369 isoform X2 n=1 Tax=Corythoichthys intestinalis TaxID=161448 RepID=UPI0025A684CA|nr:uncharacterized protein LOC130930369 isoform X2 [Corythoichthys intestinalis]
MHFDSIFVLVTLARLSLTLPVPVDTMVVQLQQWVVLGTQPVLGRVLLNGVPYPGATQEVNGIIQMMSADLIPLKLLANQTGVLRKGYTVLRSRDCVLEGSELHWADRVFSDGSLYLSLDHSGVWVAHTQQAMALKASWEQAVGSLESLQDGCVNLMGKLRFSKDQSGIPMSQFFIPILGLLAFIGVTALSLLLYTKLRVIGSIIHYSKDEEEVHTEKKGNGYRSL